jgi:hypothetical protein
MGKMKVILPDELEEKFRQEVGKRFGAKKGNLTKAFIEAVQLWIKEAPE